MYYTRTHTHTHVYNMHASIIPKNTIFSKKVYASDICMLASDMKCVTLMHAKVHHYTRQTVSILSSITYVNTCESMFCVGKRSVYSACNTSPDIHIKRENSMVI